MAATGTAAASAKDRLAGFSANLSSITTPVLGTGPTAHAENLVTWFEAGYIPANRFNLASHITAYSFVLWFAQPSQYAGEVRPASEDLVNWIDGGPMNFYQYFIILGDRFCCLRKLQHIRWPVLCTYNRFHKVLRGGRCRRSFIAPCSRRWMDHSRNVRASFAVSVRAPQGSCAPSAQPCALACAGES